MKTTTQSQPRNTFVTLMAQQYGGKGGVMKDRRAPRGGSKNKKAAYLSGNY